MIIRDFSSVSESLRQTAWEWCSVDKNDDRNLTKEMAKFARSIPCDSSLLLAETREAIIVWQKQIPTAQDLADFADLKELESFIVKYRARSRINGAVLAALENGATPEDIQNWLADTLRHPPTTT